MVGESAQNAGKELWYSAEYVSKQLDRLKHGSCAFCLLSRCFSRGLTYLSAGRWLEMHVNASSEGDTIKPPCSKIVGIRHFKNSRLFPDVAHEGVDLLAVDQDSSEGILFVPGGCIRAA